MNGAPLIDMRQFATELASRRNKAAMLMTPSIGGQRAYAAQLAAALEVPHLDVLDHFRADEGLMARLIAFSMADLLDLISGLKGDKLVVLSGIEFLLAAWISQGEPKHVKRSFCQQIELWERLPAFILVTQEDAALGSYQPERHRGSRVVLHISETLALE